MGRGRLPGDIFGTSCKKGRCGTHGQRSRRTNTEDELCWSDDAKRGCSGGEWLGSLSCPLGKLSLQPPGYFGTLKKAKFQMYHRERSCFRQQGPSVPHGAMSFLTRG